MRVTHAITNIYKLMSCLNKFSIVPLNSLLLKNMGVAKGISFISCLGAEIYGDGSHPLGTSFVYVQIYLEAKHIAFENHRWLAPLGSSRVKTAVTITIVCTACNRNVCFDYRPKFIGDNH